MQTLLDRAVTTDRRILSGRSFSLVDRAYAVAVLTTRLHYRVSQIARRYGYSNAQASNDRKLGRFLLAYPGIADILEAGWFPASSVVHLLRRYDAEKVALLIIETVSGRPAAQPFH